MKRPPLLLAGVLFVTVVAISALSAKAQNKEVSSYSPLRNRDVLTLVETKHPADAIITIIRFSQCNFDTFPPILLDLQHRGVPGEVLQAMIEAPYGPSTESRNNDNRDDLAEQPIYHYIEQLKSFLAPTTAGRRLPTRQSRARASRRRS
ncbi:MAG: hypothetical protein ACR2LM_13555 [Pyrinomonadaceae bacterium]